MSKLLAFFLIITLYTLPFTLYPFPTHAGWNVDLAPPTCFVFPTGTFQVGLITFLYISAEDNNGINSLSLAVPGVALPPPTCSRVSCACPAGACVTLTKTYSWTPTVAGSPYTLNVSARDNSGNPCAISPTLSISDEIQPWIQTTGDVHSNTNINTPGGP